ncbi:hypothetical protein F4825DRAFT_46527 [Nemania diffusa]|nr:hypothetical protein F4825DRAFT_46527 [Nemania diffusa]
MDPNIFEMAVPQQNQFHCGLATISPMSNYSLQDPGKPCPAYLVGDQQDPGVRSQGPPPSGMRPLFNGMAVRPTPGTSCLFLSEVLDDCAKARFYARALEFYLLTNEHQNTTLQCLSATCVRTFTDPREMLKHLKNCKFLEKGQFFCPACHQYESFRVRSGRRCSWDKEDFSQRVRQKSKDFFQGFTGSRSSSHAYCAKCSCSLSKSQPHPAPTYPRPELDSVNIAISELIVETPEMEGDTEQNHNTDLRSENSLSPPYPPPGYASVNLGSDISDMSPNTMSPDKVSTASSISSLSPSAYEEQPTRRKSSTSILSRANRRSAGLWSGSDNGNYTEDQRLPSLYSRVSTSQGVGSFVPISPPLPHETFIELPNSPLMLEQLRNVPKLQLETPNDTTNPTGSMIHFQPLYHNHLMDYTPDIPIQGIASLPVEISYQTLSELSQLFTATPDDEPIASEPSSSVDTSPPVSAVPTSASQTLHAPRLLEQKLKCTECRKTFRKQSYLKKHKSTHDPDRKRITCNTCKTEFTRQDNLTVHLRKIHDSNHKPLRRRRNKPADSLSESRLKRKVSPNRHHREL